MVCHSDCKYLRQVSSIINFLNLSDEDSYHHLQQKHLDVTSIWNCVCCQYCTVLPVCCGALSCITTSMLYYNFTHSHKKRKDYGTFPFLRSFGNANLTLIWPHHHFQQKNMKVLFWPKYQCWSWYTVIKFVWSSTTSSWSPEICYRYTAIQFVCSWSTSRKELIVKF